MYDRSGLIYELLNNLPWT